MNRWPQAQATGWREQADLNHGSALAFHAADKKRKISLAWI